MYIVGAGELYCSLVIISNRKSDLACMLSACCQTGRPSHHVTSYYLIINLTIIILSYSVHLYCYTSYQSHYLIPHDNLILTSNWPHHLIPPHINSLSDALYQPPHSIFKSIASFKNLIITSNLPHNLTHPHINPIIQYFKSVSSFSTSILILL